MDYLTETLTRENLRLKKMAILLEVNKQLYEARAISQSQYVSDLGDIYKALTEQKG